jgi:hypothetical protein
MTTIEKVRVNSKIGSQVLQLALVCPQGEVKRVGDIRAMVDGEPIPAQFTERTHWTDGRSLRVVSASVLVRGEMNVEFVAGEKLPSAQMPAAAAVPNVNAQVRMGDRVVADLLTMMAGASWQWEAGPLAYTSVVTDHAHRTWDFGLGDIRPVRPIWYVTWFPTTGHARVRLALENSDTESLAHGDLPGLKVAFIDHAGEALIAGAPSVAAGTRAVWSAWWDGSSWEWELSPHHEMDVQRDAAVLAERAAVLPYTDDPDSIARSVAKWRIVSQQLADDDVVADPYAAGWLRPAGAAGGDHPQIGHYPDPDVAWLLSGNSEVGEVACFGGTRCNAYPHFYREGRAGLASSGRWVTVFDRPSLMLSNLGYSYTREGDRITPVGPIRKPATKGGDPWDNDPAHLPNWAAIPFLMTGDVFFLETMQGVAAWAAARSNGAATKYHYGRGPTGSEGGLTGQVRGQAWAFAQRLDALQFTPESDPYHAYLVGITFGAIQVWRGERALMLPGLDELPQDDTFDWGARHTPNYRHASTPPRPPACELTSGNPAYATWKNHVDESVVKTAEAGWQMAFLTAAWWKAHRLGLAVKDLLACATQFWTVEILHPDNSEGPRVDAYVRPMTDAAGWVGVGARFHYVMSEDEVPSDLPDYVRRIAPLPLDSNGRNSNPAYGAFMSCAFAAAAEGAELLEGVEEQDLADAYREIGRRPAGAEIWKAWVGYHGEAPRHDLNWYLAPGVSETPETGAR